MKMKQIVLRRAMMMMLVVVMLVLHTVPAYAANFNKNYSLSGTSAAKMVSVAEAQLERSKSTMGYYDSWCARFVSDVASIVGESAAIPYNAGCRQLYNAIIQAGGKDVSSPQKGDIVFFVCTSCKVSGYNNAYSHVGIMVDNSGTCISGNYNEKVTKHSVNSYAYEPHSVSSGVVTLKYVRPNYSNASGSSGPSVSHNITLSSSSANLEIGKTTSISVTITTSGSANLNYEVSNGSICSVSWQNSSCTRTSDTMWTNTLKLTGVSAGSSTLTLKLTDANTGAIRATKTLSITVPPSPNATPPGGNGSPISHSITLSASSTYLEVGKTTSIAVTITTSGAFNLGGEFSNGAICSASWQNSSCTKTSDTTWTNTLKLTGVSAGSSTLTLKLTDANTGAVRATKTLSITVAPPPDVTPTVTFSKNSLSIEEGKTETVSASIQWGSATGGRFGINNSSVATVSGKGGEKTWDMTVQGQSAGSTELYINMYNSSGKTLLTKTIPVTVTPAAKPSVSVNPSSVMVTAGETAKINVNFQLNGAKEAVFRVDNPNICSANWGSQNTSDNQRTLTIAGLTEGTTSVAVELRNSAGQVMASQQIAVTVKPKPQQVAEPLKLNVNTDALILDLSGQSAQASSTANISWTGTVPEGSKISVSSSSTSGYDPNAVSLSWGSKTTTSRELIIAGNQESRSLLEIAIKDKTGTVLASKTVEVTVVRSNNISLSLSKSSIHMGLDETANIIVSYRGGNLAWGYGKDCPVEVNMSSADTGSMTLLLSPRAVGTGTCTFKVIEDTTSKVLAAETLTVTVTNSIEDEIAAYSLKSAYATVAAYTELEDEIDSNMSGTVLPQGSVQSTLIGFSSTGTTEFSGQSTNTSTGISTESSIDISGAPASMPETVVTEGSISAGGVSASVPGTAVTVNGVASMEPNGTSASTQFTDIDANEYYFEPILWAQDVGATAGVTGTTLDPNGDCPRGQVVDFLWRAMGSPEPKSTSNPFTDVSSSDSYYKAVLWAYKSGVTSGTTVDAFSPNNTCTRGQVMTFLWRAKNKPAASGGNLFTDVKEGEYYEIAVNWAVEESITYGTSATTFSPNATCTRAQILTFLYRCVFEETPEKT